MVVGSGVDDASMHILKHDHEWVWVHRGQLPCPCQFGRFPHRRQQDHTLRIHAGTSYSGHGPIISAVGAENKVDDDGIMALAEA